VAGFEQGDGSKLIEFAKIIAIALFTTGMVKNRDYLRIFIWVIALSFGFYGVKSGLQGVLSGGSMEIRQGPGGMMLDRNDFSLALCMAIPMLLNLGTSEKKPILRRAAFAMVPLTAMTVMFTHSRGAFVTLAITLFVLIWRSRNRLTGMVAGGLMAAAFLGMAPKAYFDRLKTIIEYEDDGSAMGRIDAWVVAGNMIQANPILGVGFGKFEENYTKYDPKMAEIVAGGTEGRVAHNSYLQIWAECGTIAFLIYVSLIVISILDIWRVRRIARQRYDQSWIISYCNMFEASLIAFTVGSMFLNRAQFDLFYHVVALSIVFSKIATDTMENEVAKPRQRDEIGQLVAADTAGFGRRRSQGGFRNSPLAPGQT
jgi:probable O-glycosylation ligase (exosortase A-associated)